MKFSYVFTPRWQNSSQEVRMRAVERIKDIKLLEQIAGKDKDPMVCEAAKLRLEDLQVKEAIVDHLIIETDGSNSSPGLPSA